MLQSKVILLEPCVEAPLQTDGVVHQNASMTTLYFGSLFEFLEYLYE
jgi:hypothetical protein